MRWPYLWKKLSLPARYLYINWEDGTPFPGRLIDSLYKASWWDSVPIFMIKRCIRLHSSQLHMKFSWCPRPVNNNILCIYVIGPLPLPLLRIQLEKKKKQSIAVVLSASCGIKQRARRSPARLIIFFIVAAEADVWFVSDRLLRAQISATCLLSSSADPDRARFHPDYFILFYYYWFLDSYISLRRLFNYYYYLFNPSCGTWCGVQAKTQQTHDSHKQAIPSLELSSPFVISALSFAICI